MRGYLQPKKDMKSIGNTLVAYAYYDRNNYFEISEHFKMLSILMVYSLNIHIINCIFAIRVDTYPYLLMKSCFGCVKYSYLTMRASSYQVRSVPINNEFSRLYLMYTYMYLRRYMYILRLGRYM